MEINPYSGDDAAKVSEHLRLALSLLSKHKIPPSPLNYRLGYDYVAGKEVTLKPAFDELVAQPGSPSEEALWEMYRRFFVQDDKALAEMRNELRQIIINIQSECEQSEGNLSNYATTLNRFAGILDATASPAVMATEVQKVIEDTREMERSQNHLVSQISDVLSEVKSLRKELEQVKEESLIDALTQISNRKAFDTALDHAIRSAEEGDTEFCLLLADIDYFKRFNDTYGHLVGDKVLRFVASTLKRCTKEHDIAARYGGEEFAVILPTATMAGAETVAEQMRKAISTGILKDKANGKGYGKVTISIGIAQFRREEASCDVVRRADQALYFAKERGRNRVEQAA